MTQIIVEIGLNHLGSEERAWRMLECAAVSAVAAVTFQIREPKFYENPDPVRHRLSADFYRQAVIAVHARGQRCGIAIADESSVEPFNSLGVDFWKTLSWDFKNSSLNLKLQSTGKPVWMSTGLSGMDEIVEVSAKGGNIGLIHTQLSQKIEDVNLKAIAEIRKRTHLPVAFGLHCACHDVLKVALGLEPAALLFYLKEDGVSQLFDDEHAIPMSELKSVTNLLKSLESALGTGTKSGAEKPSWVVH
jgi:sialic acid synthase SpsE